MPLQSFKTKYLKHSALNPSIILLNQSHWSCLWDTNSCIWGTKKLIARQSKHFTNAAFNVFAKVITVMEVRSLDIALKT